MGNGLELNFISSETEAAQVVEPARLNGFSRSGGLVDGSGKDFIRGRIHLFKAITFASLR